MADVINYAFAAAAVQALVRLLTMIADKLIPCLQARFSNRSVKFGKTPEAIAVFAAQHPQVGDVQVFDDGEEITVVMGHFTHCHFSGVHSNLAEDREQTIVDEVVDFFDRLFADQIVLWGSHRSSGGSYNRGSTPSRFATGPRYVWSGPLADE